MRLHKKLLSVMLGAAMLCTLPIAGTSAQATEMTTDAYEWGTLGISGGGFVSGIVTGKEVMYCRTDVGGAYKYNYDTEEWEQLLDFLNESERGFLSVDAMCIDPTDDDTVYMLCGCAYFSDARTVIYKTTDGGETFTEIDVTDLIQVHGNGYGRQCGEAIAVDPDNPDVLYCGGDVTAGDSALIWSQDGGETWEPVMGYDDLGYFSSSIKWPTWTEHMTRSINTDEYGRQNGVAAIAIKDGKVYVGTSISGTSNVVVADVGVNEFSTLSADLPTSYFPSKFVFDSAGDLLITYLSSIFLDKTSGAIYKYDTTSGTVTDISPSTEGYGGISSDPENPDLLIASTCANSPMSQLWYEGAWDDNNVAWGERYFRSTDGGASWEEITPGNTKGWNQPLMADYLQDGGRPWIRNKSIHWSGSAVIDPKDPDRFLTTSGNGIFECSDIWGELPVYTFHSDGIEEVVALDMVSIPGGNPVSVIGDYDGFIHTSLTESTQLTPSMNTLTDSTASTAGIAYCPSNPDVMVRLAESFAKGFYTTDGGATWTELPCTMSGAKAAINQLEDGTYRIFLSNEGKIAYTDDFGGSWTDVSIPEQMSSDIMLCVDAENPQYVYAYGYYYNQYYFYSKPSATIDDARYVLMVSDDYGATFSQSQIICQYDECDSAARIAYLGEGEIAIAAGWYGAYHVTDYGKTVTKMDSVFYCKTMGYGAPKEEGGSNTLFMYGKPTETDVEGIYRSDDKGVTWECINTDKLYGGTGNGNFLVGDMNEYGTVYMSTVGCGIVYGRVSEGGEPTTEPTTDAGDEPLYGDSNVDGDVGVADVILVNQYYMKTADLEAQGLINADVDRDEDVDLTDSLNILKSLIDLVTLPVA